MGWAYYRSLEIDHTKCGSSDSSSFPVLVYGFDASLKDAAHGGHVQSSSGADILFFADNGGATQYPSEIDYYDNVNGVLWAWVQVPTVSHAANATFYLLYDNASPPSRTTGVWDSNFRGVYHFGNGATYSALDSSGNGNDLNYVVYGTPTAAAGVVAGAISFDGASALRGGPTLSFPSSAATFEMWVKPTSISATQYVTDGYNNAGGSDNHLTVILGFQNGYWNAYPYPTGTASDSEIPASTSGFQHIVFTSDGSRSYGYLNGAQIFNVAGVILSAAVNQYEIGTGFAGYNFTGLMDELRISDALRSADWILTEYANQNSPGNIGSPGFLTWGAETAVGGGGNSYSSSPVETFSVSEGFGKLTARPLGESFRVSELFGRLTARGVSESISLADTLARGAGKSAADTLGQADSLMRASGKALSDPFSPSEAATKGTGRALTEAPISLIEAFAKGVGKACAEAFSAIEAFARGTAKAVSDTFSLSEVFGAIKAKVLNLVDAIAPSEGIARAMQRTAVDAIAVGDSVGRAIGRALSETFALAESVAAGIRSGFLAMLALLGVGQ